MSTSKTYSIIEDALRKGNVLRAFLSGGGLRVVRLEKDHTLTGYGEHPHIDEALRHVAEDFAAGGRPYGEVYGSLDSKDGLYPMYLTGASTPNGPLDAWVRGGNKFTARFACQMIAPLADGVFEVDLCGWGEHKTPNAIHERAMAGEVIEWTDARGCTFQSGPTQFPNGSIGSSTKPLSRPAGMPEHRVWMWHTSQKGRAAMLSEAFKIALEAKPVEVDCP